MREWGQGRGKECKPGRVGKSEREGVEGEQVSGGGSVREGAESVQVREA